MIKLTLKLILASLLFQTTLWPCAYDRQFVFKFEMISVLEILVPLIRGCPPKNSLISRRFNQELVLPEGTEYTVLGEGYMAKAYRAFDINSSEAVLDFKDYKRIERKEFELNSWKHYRAISKQLPFFLHLVDVVSVEGTNLVKNLKVVKGEDLHFIMTRVLREYSSRLITLYNVVAESVSKLLLKSILQKYCKDAYTSNPPVKKSTTKRGGTNSIVTTYIGGGYEIKFNKNESLAEPDHIYEITIKKNGKLIDAVIFHSGNIIIDLDSASPTLYEWYIIDPY